ncbi:heme ABC transporter ATP-binding protein [Thiomicrorhabdus sp.]|uniref:heme ABC transporter ATP-binding protein n=1 Tax=Thiomicrorhabdus sp. TaxID=2039724 RepID=UPI0029C970EB|nr:heme ABC transporter ATP-binding protein [Thiomicrorhabdus sp.]
MLEVENLTVELEHKTILHDVSLTLEPGEVLSVLGPNGAGKSTLLKALSGDVRHYHGDIRLNGRDLRFYDVRTLAEQRAVMPQKIQLDFPFLVEEVLQMALEPLAKEKLHAQIRYALARFDVEHLIGRSFVTLSGGEQQRVQLARVLLQLSTSIAREGGFLFLDECTSSLDLAHQHQVFQVVRDFARRNRVGVLSVLHDLNLASQYSDRVLLLKQGRVLAFGSVQQVFAADQLSRMYDFPVSVSVHPHGWPLVIPA